MATWSVTDRASDATGLASVLGLLGRLLMAAIFLISGVGKIANAEATAGYIASVGLPLPNVALVVAIVIEVIGGAALVLGYRTRLVAGVLALFCIVTAASFHAAFDDPNQLIHFLKNLTMAGGFLQIVVFGPGALSMDARFHRAANNEPAAA